MSDAFVIQVAGRTAGIVTRDRLGHSYNFFSAAPRFDVMEGRQFSDPLEAERAARKLAEHGSLPGRRESTFARKRLESGRRERGPDGGLTFP